MMNDTLINPLIGTALPNAQRSAEPKSDSRADGTTPRESTAVEPRQPVQDELRLDRQSLAERAEALLESAPAEPPSKDDLSSMVELINDYLQTAQRELQFEVDDASGFTLIKVLNQNDGQVIRQIPPETMVELATFLRDQGKLDSFGVTEQA